MGQILLVTFLCVFLLVFLIDLVPAVKDWGSRVRIGKYREYSLWNHLLIKRASKWLLSMPKIKVTDNTRLIVIDMLKGNYTKNAIQHWQEASLILGISEYLKQNEDKQVRKQVIKFLNRKFDTYGQWIDKPKHVDAAMLAYAIMQLDFIDIRQYRLAFESILELIKSHVGQDGTVEYRKHMGIYRYVDTIGLICPFLVGYGVRFNKDEYIRLAIKQIKEYEKNGMLEKHGIPCHAYNTENLSPVGLYGWGRGLGWFAIGLIDSWNELPDNSVYKPLLETSVKKLAGSVMDVQQDNGSWNWNVLRIEARSDSSSTAALGWFLLIASRIQNISSDCLTSFEKSVIYLMKVTRRNGAVDFSQGDTKDLGVYSMHFNTLPFTQGFCIRSMNRYQQLQKKKEISPFFQVNQKEFLYGENRVFSNLQ